MRAIICEDIGGKDSRCITIETRSPECDPRCREHRPPAGYVVGAEWAEHMQQTHVQRRCPGCGLWTIWEPKPDRSTADKETEPETTHGGPMDNVALDRLYRMAREWESGVEYRDDDNLDDRAEGKVAGYSSCARDLLAFVEYQRDVEADKARQGEHGDAHAAGGR